MPHRNAMDLMLRAAARRLAAPPAPCCELDSLAAEAGVEPEMARRLFSSTEEVLKAVAESALRRQLDHLTRRLSCLSDRTPAEQLVCLAKSYVEWSIENPDEFRVLNSHLIRSVIDDEELVRYNRSLQRLILSMLERAREQGQLRHDIDPDLLSLVARSFTYGAARLCADRQLPLWEAYRPEMSDKDRLFAAVEAFADLVLTGWRSDQPIRSDA